MTTDEILFWNEYPRPLPIYEAFSAHLAERYPDMIVKASKTRISFYNRHIFAVVPAPKKCKKDRLKEFVLVSVGLSYHLESSGVLASVEVSGQMDASYRPVKYRRSR